MLVLTAEGLKDLLTVMTIPRAGRGGQPLHPGVEQVDDGVDAVTAGALVGGLQQVEVSAHGSSNGEARAQEVVLAVASSGLKACLSAPI
jgi:hypothetical protein